MRLLTARPFIAIAFAPSLLVCQPFLPIEAGNQWTLADATVTSQIVLAVTDARAVGPLNVRSLSMQGLRDDLTLLAIEGESGLVIEGQVVNGVTAHYDSPVTFFRADAREGEIWATPLGFMALRGANRTVTTRVGVFSNCLRYVLTRDGTSYAWTVKPGIGFVQFEDGTNSYLLTARSSTPNFDQTSQRRDSKCPPLGIASIPNLPSTTTNQREAALNDAVRSGSRFLNVNATWAELEPAPGVYAFDRVRDEMALGQKFGLPTVFTVKITNTNVRDLPADIYALAFDNPTVISRLDRLLTALRPIIPPQVKWINLGYEADVYLFANPQEVAPLQTLLRSGFKKLKSLGDFSVGAVQSFDTFRHSDLIFKTLAADGDHLAFNYYALGQDFAQRAPEVALVDIPLMGQIAGKKPVVITELGYSSGGANTNVERQQQFFNNALGAISLEAGVIAGVSVWALRDLPWFLVVDIANQQGLTSSFRFASFLASLGLQDQGGGAKPAWASFTAATAGYQVNQGCKVTPSPLRIRNAAALQASGVAPDSWISLFGSELATTTASAQGPPAESLGGSRIAVIDSAGRTRAALLSYASADQINAVVPAGTASGQARVQVSRSDGVTQSATVNIAAAAPGIFTANSSGTGVVSALALAIAPNGTRRSVDVFSCASGSCAPVPIDVSAGTVVLSLYCTGVRGAGSAPLKVTIGGQNADVLYAGIQGQYAALDQINVVIPRSLQGRGLVDVVVSVGGTASNGGKIQIR